MHYRLTDKVKHYGVVKNLSFDLIQWIFRFAENQFETIILN